jgi:uncharacterized protein (TIGR03437 family)
MHLRKFLSFLVLLGATVNLCLYGNNVFVHPGGSASQQPVTLFNGNTLQSVATFSTVSGVIKTIAAPDGSRFYTLTRVNDPGLLLINSSTPGQFTNVRLPDSPRDMILSPDGSRLLIFTNNTVLFYNVGTGNLTDLGATAALGRRPIAAAFSEAGDIGYFLSSEDRSVVRYNFVTSAVTAPLRLPFGENTGIVASSDGRLFVTATNRILIVDAVNLRNTAQVELNGRPLKPVLTGDEKYLLATNETPITGAAAFIYEIPANTLKVVARTHIEPVADLTLVSNTRAIGRGESTGGLYDIDLDGAGLRNLSASGATPPGNVSSLAASDEVPARSLFVYATSGLHRLDLSAQPNVWSSPVALANPTGTVSYANRASTGPVTKLTSTVAEIDAAPNQLLPSITVRLLDAQNRPVPGVPVTFNVNNTNFTAVSSDAASNPLGFARVRFRTPAGALTGTLIITAGNANLNIPVRVSASGGGSGAVRSGVFIIRGNGIVVPQNQASGSYPTVEVRGDDGRPIEGARVTFQIAEGPAQLNEPIAGVPGVQGAGCRLDPQALSQAIVCTTDANGRASTGLRGGPINDNSSFRPVTINATANGRTATFKMQILGGVTPAPPVPVVLKPDQSDFAGIIEARAGQVLENAIRILFISNAVGGSTDGRPMPNVGFRVVDPQDNTTTCDAEGGIAVSVAVPRDPDVVGDQPGDGVASCTLRVGSVLGERVLRVELYGDRDLANGIVTLRVAAPLPTAITPIQGNNFSGIPGQTTNLVARVTGQSNQPIRDVRVAFTVASGTATLSNIRDTTNDAGEVSATLTLGQTPGPVSVRLAIGSLNTTFASTILAPVQSLRRVSGDGQSAITEDNFLLPLVIQVVGPTGAGVNGQRVDFTVVNGPVTLVNNTAQTGPDGTASASVRAGATAGAALIRATVGSLSVDFNLTVRNRGVEVNPSNFSNAFTGQTGLICPGCIVTITSRGVASGVTGLVPTNRWFTPYPSSFGGLTVTIANIAAPILSVFNGIQGEAVTIQVPWEVSGGTTAVNFSLNGVQTTATVPVRPAWPAFVEYPLGGGRNATVLDNDGLVLTQVRRGGRYRVVMSGLGQTVVRQVTGRIAIPGQELTPANQYTMAIGNAGVPVTRVEAVPNQFGLYYVTFDVPADSRLGDNLNLDFLIREPSGASYVAPASRISVVQ